jgi:RNA polymerase sigma-70 factor (ECF subfamily)
MLGSVAEAEDVVQDAWTRWQSTDRGVVRDPQAFLTTTTTRLAINVLQSARTRREPYVGPWRPEPVDTSADPSVGAERAEALELAVLMLLERLSPAERAAYVLREAFNYPHKEIAEVLRVEEANARQLVTRARQHVTDGRRARVSSGDQKRLLHAFVAASQTGDVAELERLFAADVVSQADGGGFVRAAQKPVGGRERVAKYIASVSEWGWSGVTVTLMPSLTGPISHPTRHLSHRGWSTGWRSHSSNRISPSRASPAGINDRSPTSAPKYRACGSTTTSRGSLRAARP